MTADTGICRLMVTHSVRVRAHLHTPYNPNITASIDNVLVEKIMMFSSSGVGDYRIKRIQTVTIKNTAY